MTGFNVKERATSGTTKILLGLETWSSSSVEDADVNMFYFLTSSKNKQFAESEIIYLVSL
jgi:hypothetical protein